MLDSHPCTEEDFDAFYELSEQQKYYEDYVKNPNHYSICFNEEDL